MEESKQILMAIAELQADVRNMNAKIGEISQVTNLVRETDQRAKSAHERINDLKTDFSDKLQSQKDDYERGDILQKERIDKLEENTLWLKRAVVTGAIGFIFELILGLILFFTIGGK